MDEDNNLTENGEASDPESVKGIIEPDETIEPSASTSKDFTPINWIYGSRLLTHFENFKYFFMQDTTKRKNLFGLENQNNKTRRLQYSLNYKNPPSSSFPVNQDLNQQLTHTPQHVRETYDTQVEEMLKYIEQNLDDLLTSTFSSTSSTNTTNNTTPQPHTHIIDYHKIGFINIHGAFNQKLNNILQ
ncbi:hypothetical protein RhiirC2_772925 [Rhizophagus irregularis]|uniref:Uncharacterized protein n=1 Tax=Rhizophagus irregularis TaxID=588596 RepID=A0A2N1NQA8_9GLOM|nr:hypothetical protein RhiirC2_772925 [Rhizophagus irregularis]